MTLTSRYDTNVQLEPNGQSDMVYIASPKLGVRYEGGAATIIAGYRMNAEFFSSHPELNHVQQELALETDFSRMISTVLPKGSTTQLRETFLYTPILPDFQSMVTPASDASTGGVRTPRTNTMKNIFEIEESIPVSTLTRIVIGYRNSYTQYQDSTLIDSQMNEGKISFKYDMSRTDLVTSGYSYRRYNPSGGDVSQIHTLSISERHDFSPILSGEAAAGMIAAVLPSEDHPQYSAHGVLLLTRLFKSKTRVDLRGSRYLDAASGVSSIPLTTDRASISLSREFTTDLSVETSLHAARNYSVVTDAGTGRPFDIHSHGVNIKLQYQWTTWLMSDLDYQYYRQETMGSYQADLSRSQYSVQLRAKWI